MATENHLSGAPLSANMPLYSARAVRLFSIFFSPIAGGALTARNLRDVGQPTAARKALWGSIIYLALLLWLTSYLPDSMGHSWLAVVVGYAGSAGLEWYFGQFVQHRNDFPAKSIRTPLVVCLLIFVIPLFVLVLFSAIIFGEMPWTAL
ncbi:hypothetical protein IC235_19155 [Hymenobacter sp. BT664]|uniref:Uncharacterized protein n=1 Tax=Hymenobacter montanus TaxID=2771359 RepID=A0A927BGG9_9BACT|nr:hypothetical protein [Hymenobacter montanus]MBD2770011.1 hypothetical protein [Hymenobacter montanus]